MILNNHSCVRLDVLKRYLRVKNWRLIPSPMENLLTYEGPLDDINRPIKIVLPINAEFDDVPSRIAKALNLLSAIEACTVHDIEETVMNLGSDFFRQRIITSSNISTIPLAMANKVISTLTALVSYSACLEERCNLFLQKGEILEKKS